VIGVILCQIVRVWIGVLQLQATRTIVPVVTPEGHAVRPVKNRTIVLTFTAGTGTAGAGKKIFMSYDIFFYFYLI